MVKRSALGGSGGGGGGTDINSVVRGAWCGGGEKWRKELRREMNLDRRK